MPSPFPTFRRIRAFGPLLGHVLGRWGLAGVLALGPVAPALAQTADAPKVDAPKAAPGKTEPVPDAGQTPPPGVAPAVPDDGDLSSPPVVDPKAVETQPVPPAPPANAQADDPMKRPDGFGELVQMQPKPVLTVKGQSSWDDGFQTIVKAVTAVDAELARLKLKPLGAPLVVYTGTDDAGFDYEVAMPFAGATTEKPGEGFAFSASPAGKALRFTHRGSYDAMDPTYEQIANLLDAKDLEAQDLYVEEYRSDPRTSSPDDLVIDIFVPLK
ncbi:GyrI-like domain-containing protein [Ancylobacter sp. 6x-1]|uniref:GyrI-like domain-containing protein n=1 Tax=Ancylobacter crimeensis TaxID=2579147 RepID=A0ABT0DCR7_9HYPH|nr:GyrI-like domain-containing protein [Ancylobacter crimeensis]MCK0197537.1 GyrI-like domain-containing protein [Ancylobacter crimeensis]